MAFPIKALHDRVFVKRLDQVKQTESGLVIPEAAQEEQFRGKVLAVGPGGIKLDGTRVAMTVKEGDMVLFPERHGWEVEFDGEEITILREKDILAIVE
jgi:chaperonin GroES